MFSKTRANESVPQPSSTTPFAAALPDVHPTPAPVQQQKPKPSASVLSSDLTITGNVRSSGDIQVEGIVEGDIRAQVLIVGETATVKGEVFAEEVVVHGRVVGRLRGLKVRLSTTARVEGDIVHKTIAIESGAHFEGSVHRQDDPLSQNAQPARITGPAKTPAPAQAQSRATQAAE